MTAYVILNSTNRDFSYWHLLISLLPVCIMRNFLSLYFIDGIHILLNNGLQGFISNVK